MTTKIESIAGGVRVTGEMTVYTASQIKQPLVDATTGGPETILLDLSGVSDLDTAGLQLLLLIHREVLASGRNLLIGPESTIVRDVLTLCGALGLLTDSRNVGQLQ
jgi:anti-sigma B factor antagonist